MKGLAVGQSASVTRVFDEADISAYRALTADTLLQFASVEQANSTVPGPLLGAMFSQLLGTRLPGRGTNWLKLSLHYRTVALVGEQLTATVTVTRLRPEKELVNLRAACVTQRGTVVCEGDALVLVKDLI